MHPGCERFRALSPGRGPRRPGFEAPGCAPCCPTWCAAGAAYGQHAIWLLICLPTTAAALCALHGAQTLRRLPWWLPPIAALWGATVAYGFTVAMTAWWTDWLAACCLPAVTFGQLAGTALPFQDPTPEMLERQAAESAARERRFIVSLVAGAVLAILGLPVALLGLRRIRARRPAAPSGR